MAMNNLTSVLVIIVAVFALVLLAHPNHATAGIGMDVGCCRTVDQAPNAPGGVCVGCADDNCITLDSYCADEGGFNNPGTCVSEDPQGAQCVAAAVAPGCCVTAEQVCIDDIGAEPCFDGEGGIIFSTLSSCSELAACNIERNVPAFGKWGFIALAVFLGLFAVIVLVRSRKAAV